MLLSHRPTKLLITGKSGTGKTTYWSRFLFGAFRVLYQTIFVFDHQGEFSQRFNITPALTERDLLSQLDRGFVLFDPCELFAGDFQAGFEFFCEWSFEMSKDLCKQGKATSRLMACDELQVLIGTDTISWEFSLVLETGRRWGLDTAFVSQQPNLVHNRIRNQLTEVVTFQHIDPLVLDCLIAWGFDPNEVLQLEVGDFLLRNFTTGESDGGNIFAKLGLTKPKKERTVTATESGQSVLADGETTNGKIEE